MNPKSIRDKILSEMKAGLSSQHILKADDKTYERLSDVIDPQSEDAIIKLLGEPAKVEIEVSFGSYKEEKAAKINTQGESGPSFSPGLFSAYQFEALLADLSKITDPRIYNDRTEIMKAEYTRRIIDFTSDPENPRITYQKKYRRRADFVENTIWGYRISKSTEEFTTEPDIDFVPDIIRNRRRHSFIIRDASSGMYGFQFDLSHIKETKMKQIKVQTEEEAYDPEYKDEAGELIKVTKTKMVEDKTYIKYEVEIERVSSVAANGRIPIENLANAIRFVLMSIQDVQSVEHLMTLEEIRDVVGRHNSLFAADIAASGAKMTNPYRMFKDYWNKPTNITIDNLLDTRVNDMAVTVKLDGIRQFLYITRSGTYALGPPTDMYCIGKGIPHLNGTLLDTEKYDGPDGITYYAFDVLFSRGASVRQARFQERMNILQNLVNAIDAEKGEYKVIKKHFYTKGTVYEKVSDALGWIEENPDYASDGLIFQPPIWYKNKHTKKWKPSSQLTIDVKFEKKRDENGEAFNEEYVPYISDRRGDVPFKGTERNPYTKTIHVKNGVFEGVSVDGAIIECKWDADEKNFVIYRFRRDRDRPNAYKTATDVWEDIMNPITRATIEGDSLRVMRRYHNIMKLNMLKTEFPSGSRIMDWGSGRGGDLGKWADIGMKKVYVVEPNENNLEELERRMDQMKKKVDVEICRDTLTGNLLGGEDTEALLRVLSRDPNDKGIDGIVSFFSLTFFGRDQERWDAMLDSFDLLLENGGKVVGIVMDGDRTRALLDEDRLNQGIADEDAVDYVNKSFMISQMSEFTDPSVSAVENEIEIKIFEETSMVRGEGASGGQQEWLFYFDKFRADMENRGFTLIRNGFLDTDPKERTAFDVLPADSKTFSKLNRYFVFNRRSHKGPSKLSGDTVVLNHLNEDEMAPFHIIPGSDIGVGVLDANLYRIGTAKGPSNFIHSVVRAFDQRYYDMTYSEKAAHIKKIRGMLGRKITKDVYDVLNDGDIATRYTLAAINDLKKAGNVSIDNETAINLGFLEYRLKIMDPTQHISGDSVSELLSNLLGVNIIMLGTDGKPKITLHGSRDCEFMRDEFYVHERTILLVSPDGVHYDLVAHVLTDDEENPSVFTVFSTNESIMPYMMRMMCEDNLHQKPKVVASNPKTNQKSAVLAPPKTKGFDYKTLIDKIIIKHKLNELESDVLRKYVEYMHAESRKSFLEKVLSSKREYLDDFLDTDIDDLENTMFGTTESPIKASQKKKLTHEELNSTIRLELYIRLIEKMKANKKVMNAWYAEFSFKPEKYKDKIERRKALYERFTHWLEQLDPRDLQNFFDDMTTN